MPNNRLASPRGWRSLWEILDPPTTDTTRVLNNSEVSGRFLFQSTAEVTCVPETNLTLSINNTEIRVLDGNSGNATDTNRDDGVPPNTVRINKNQSRSMTGKKHDNSGN